MKIVQFAFDGDPDNPFLPQHIDERSVVYTGTHDNDTTIGWYTSASAPERREVRRRLGRVPTEINWTLIELAWNAKSFLAVAPMQDLLDLGASERMNTPGRPGGNWQWRMLPDALTPELAQRLRTLNARSGRLRDDAGNVADTG
ncbi:MAG: 4-alpha-glucanotransferase, partial [Acidimicrobiia bacterium]|nr:4-alpha-glucanotransferase [Acidimicrobiia bacterium]